MEWIKYCNSCVNDEQQQDYMINGKEYIFANLIVLDSNIKLLLLKNLQLYFVKNRTKYHCDLKFCTIMSHFQAV